MFRCEFCAQVLYRVRYNNVIKFFSEGGGWKSRAGSRGLCAVWTRRSFHPYGSRVRWCGGGERVSRIAQRSSKMSGTKRTLTSLGQDCPTHTGIGICGAANSPQANVVAGESLPPPPTPASFRAEAVFFTFRFQWCLPPLCVRRSCWEYEVRSAVSSGVLARIGSS